MVKVKSAVTYTAIFFGLLLCQSPVAQAACDDVKVKAKAAAPVNTRGKCLSGEQLRNLIRYDMRYRGVSEIKPDWTMRGAYADINGNNHYVSYFVNSVNRVEDGKGSGKKTVVNTILGADSLKIQHLSNADNPKVGLYSVNARPKQSYDLDFHQMDFRTCTYKITDGKTSYMVEFAEVPNE